MLLDPQNSPVLCVAELALSESLLLKVFYNLRHRFFPSESLSCSYYSFKNTLLSVILLFSFCITLGGELYDI